MAMNQATWPHGHESKDLAPHGHESRGMREFLLPGMEMEQIIFFGIAGE
jgi:hypothetical protein